MAEANRETTPIPAQLGLWDAASLVVGIIIGVGIFQAPSSVFRDAPQVAPALATWLVGGVLALIGAFCFAEMASAYPRSGGEYIYLTRAFGPWLGFFYAWTQLAIVRPGGIGAVAYIFAIHARAAFQLGESWLVAVALAAIAVLTLFNILGASIGKNTHNALTAIKVLGLVGILIVGLGWGNWSRVVGDEASTGPLQPGWFAGSMILVLWTYSGWHEAAYIASEVKDNRRNLPLALILGTLLVTALYVAVNLALVLGLGVGGAARSNSAAADLVSLAWPGGGRLAMSGLIMISALGALNGMIFTTARIAAAFGEDHPVFRPLARWDATFRTPVRALILEAVISGVLVVGVFLWGRAVEVGEAGASHNNPFDGLVDVTAAVFWFLFLLTGIALFILRVRDPDVPRPFKAPGYPVLPLVFCAWCGYMVYGSIATARWYSLAGLAIAVAGLPLYFVRPRQREPRTR